MWYPVLEIYVLYYFLLANSFLDIKDLEFKKLGIQAGLVLVTSMELFLLFLWFKHVELIYWHPARRSAMTGVKGQKILILQQQRPTFSCTCLRYWFGCSPLKRISFNHLIMICKTIFLWNVGIWGQGQTTHWCYWEKVEMILLWETVLLCI